MARNPFGTTTKERFAELVGLAACNTQCKGLLSVRASRRLVYSIRYLL